MNTPTFPRTHHVPDLFEKPITSTMEDGRRIFLKGLAPKKQEAPATSMPISVFDFKPRCSKDEMPRWTADTMELINLYWNTHKCPFGLSDIRYRCSLDPYDPKHQWGGLIVARMKKMSFIATGYRKVPEKLNPKANGRVEVLWVKM